MTTSPLSYGLFISRAQAAREGLTFYWTGKPCKSGHVAFRRTKDANCQGCIAAQQAAKAAAKDAQSQQFTDRLRYLYEIKGMSVKNIGTLVSMSPTQVCKRLKKVGVSMRGGLMNKKYFTEQQKEEIIRLHVSEKRGATYIAAELNASVVRVKDFLIASGVYRRHISRLINLVGQTFGRTTVIAHAPSKGNTKWLCQCSCGNQHVTDGHNLKKGITKSCGCFMHDLLKARAHDLSGQRFGNLVAKSRVDRIGGSTRWHCDCDCGNTTIAAACHLKGGARISCGCVGKGESSIGAFLEGTFRNEDQSSEFYLYELANHSLIKAGIDSTGHRADTEYGQQLLAIELSRFEAWLLEQAFLGETRKLTAVPSSLADWPGRTEIRDMQEDEAIRLAVELHEQLLELGREEFAIRYLPTTPKQRQQLEAMKPQFMAA